MDQSIILKVMVEKAVEGNFKEVFKMIRDKDIILDTNSAIKIIISCCTTCNNNLTNPNNINEQDLCQLLQYLIEFICNPSEKLIDSYFQSLFFILKLLLEKKCFDKIAELKNICIPHFMPVACNKKLISIYQSICTHIFNRIVAISHSKDTRYNHSLTKICSLLSSMYKQFLSQSNLINKAYSCSVCLSAVGIDIISQEEYYSFLLNMLDKPERNDRETLYKSLIRFYLYIIANLIKKKKLEEAIICSEKTIEKCKKMFERDDYVYLNDLLEVCLWMNPKYVKNKLISSYHKKLKTLYKQYGRTTNLQTICNVISTVSIIFVQYYKNTDFIKWTKKTITDQLHFYKLLFDICQLFVGMPFQCPCNNCDIKTNINDSLKTIMSITMLGKLFIMNSSDVPNVYLFDILKYLEQSCTYTLILKENGCNKWKIFWYDVGVHLYNIGFNLYKKEDPNALGYLTLFVKNLIKFEGTESAVIDDKFLSSALSTISEINFKSNNFLKSLIISAFNIAISPKYRDTEIIRWIRYKAICKENDILEYNEIQELTLVSIIEKYRSELYIFLNSFEINEKQQIELLIFELENYKMKWKSKLPMMAAYRHLTEISDSLNSVKVFISIWGQCDFQVHDEIPKLLQKILKTYEIDIENNKSIETEIYLAYLYYLHYKFCSKNAIIKNCEDMEKTMSVLKSINDQSVAVIDCNDVCDIGSSYEALILDNYNKIMQYIQKSTEILLQIITNNCTLKSFYSVNLKQVYNLLMLIAYEYRLQRNIIFALQVLELALKIARLMQDNSFTLQSISFIIEYADVNKTDTKQLISEGDHIAEVLENEDITKQLTILITYYICKTKVYFVHDYKVAYNSFKNALELFKNVKDVKEISFLKAKLDFLYHKFIILPCKFNIEGHKEYSTIKLHTAFNDAVDHYINDKINCSYRTSLLFEINEELVKMYHSKRMPREVRCYGKEIILIAQKLILPLRTAYLLQTLAYADLISCRLDDCKVKLNGLTDILCLTKRKVATPFKSPRRIQPKICSDQIVESLTCEFKEMMLDVPSKTYYHQTSPGSPILVVERFKLPTFFDHQDSCYCFYCVCLEYQQFILGKAHLDALINEHENNTDIARDFFIGGMKIYEFFKLKQDSYQKKMKNFLTFDVLSNYKDNFLEIYCHILLDFGNYLMRSKNKDAAESINNKLIRSILPRKKEFIYLYNEILLQKISIISYAELKINKNMLKMKVETDSSVESSKTPENKQSHVSLPIQRYPQTVSPRRRLVKAINFDLLDKEDDNAEVKKSSIQSNLPPFITNAAKTPAPSIAKIKVYTKSTVKKKPLLTDIRSPEKQSTSKFLIPSSPNAYTPNALKVASKVDQGLLNKTRQLTEKLKSSTNKKSSKATTTISVNDENILGSSSSSSGCITRTTVRKNLLSELAASTEETVQTRSIRKTRRNRN